MSRAAYFSSSDCPTLLEPPWDSHVLKQKGWLGTLIFLSLGDLLTAPLCPVILTSTSNFQQLFLLLLTLNTHRERNCVSFQSSFYQVKQAMSFFYQNKLFIYTMKTEKSNRIIVAPSSLFTSHEFYEKRLTSASCRGNSPTQQFPHLSRAVFVFFPPNNSLAAWINLWFICTYLSAFHSCCCQIMLLWLESKCLLLPQIARPSIHSLTFHATQFTPALKVLMAFLDAILILPCTDHTWFCLITNSTCTPLPSVPKIIKANTKHDLLQRNSQLSIQCCFLCSLLERLFMYRCCTKPWLLKLN